MLLCLGLGRNRLETSHNQSVPVSDSLLNVFGRGSFHSKTELCSGQLAVWDLLGF